MAMRTVVVLNERPRVIALRPCDYVAAMSRVKSQDGGIHATDGGPTLTLDKVHGLDSNDPMIRDSD